MSSIGLLQAAEFRVSLLGTLGALGLMVTFGLVVQDAVRRGEASRRANALLMEANWRCKALMTRPQRELCLQRYLQQLPGSSTGLRALVLEAAASAAPARPL